MARVSKHRVSKGVRGGRRLDNLVPAEAYSVEVCGTTLRFTSVAQIRRYHDYFSQKKRERVRIPAATDGVFNGDHWERQTAFTRLPAKLLSASNRPKVVKALERALRAFADGQ